MKCWVRGFKSGSKLQDVHGGVLFSCCPTNTPQQPPAGASNLIFPLAFWTQPTHLQPAFHRRLWLPSWLAQSVVPLVGPLFLCRDRPCVKQAQRASVEPTEPIPARCPAASGRISLHLGFRPYVQAVTEAKSISISHLSSCAGDKGNVRLPPSTRCGFRDDAKRLVVIPQQDSLIQRVQELWEIWEIPPAQSASEQATGLLPHLET